MEVDVPIIEVSQCNKSYSARYDYLESRGERFTRFPVLKEHICAGWNKGKGFCQVIYFQWDIVTYNTYITTFKGWFRRTSDVPKETQ